MHYHFISVHAKRIIHMEAKQGLDISVHFKQTFILTVFVSKRLHCICIIVNSNGLLVICACACLTNENKQTYIISFLNAEIYRKHPAE